MSYLNKFLFAFCARLSVAKSTHLRPVQGHSTRSQHAVPFFPPSPLKRGPQRSAALPLPPLPHPGPPVPLWAAPFDLVPPPPSHWHAPLFVPNPSNSPKSPTQNKYVGGASPRCPRTFFSSRIISWSSSKTFCVHHLSRRKFRFPSTVSHLYFSAAVASCRSEAVLPGLCVAIVHSLAWCFLRRNIDQQDHTTPWKPHFAWHRYRNPNVQPPYCDRQRLMDSPARPTHPPIPPPA